MVTTTLDMFILAGNLFVKNFLSVYETWTSASVLPCIAFAVSTILYVVFDFKVSIRLFIPSSVDSFEISVISTDFISLFFSSWIDNFTLFKIFTNLLSVLLVFIAVVKLILLHVKSVSILYDTSIFKLPSLLNGNVVNVLFPISWLDCFPFPSDISKSAYIFIVYVFCGSRLSNVSFFPFDIFELDISSPFSEYNTYLKFSISTLSSFTTVGSILTDITSCADTLIFTDGAFFDVSVLPVLFFKFIIFPAVS